MGLFIGDALAMPVHWYYDINNLKKDFGGPITGYVKPLDEMTGGFLNKCSTGATKDEPDGDVVGTVINHGKKHLWKTTDKCHPYHVTLDKGENTLEADLVRLALRSIAQNHGKFDQQKFLTEFVTFMTTPGSHNDSFASSYHRLFFGRYQQGKSPQECLIEGDENLTDAMDALALTTAGIIASVTSEGPSDKVREAARALYNTIRRSDIMNEYIDAYADIIANVISGKKTIREAVVEVGERFGLDPKTDAEQAEAKAGAIDLSTYVGGDGSDPVVPCPIKKSFPVFLQMLYRYQDAGAKVALLASANAGGENVARGQAIGTVFGAALGVEGFPREFVEGLKKHSEIESEIKSFLNIVEKKTEL